MKDSDVRWLLKAREIQEKWETAKDKPQPQGSGQGRQVSKNPELYSVG